MPIKKSTSRVLVTGGGGFLGRHLVGQLTQAGHTVLVASSQPEDALRMHWAEHSENFQNQMVEVVHQKNLLSHPLNDIDIVIDAGFARVSQGAELAEALKDKAQFFKSIVQTNVRRVLNISSQSVYNPARTEPAHEKDQPFLTTAYSTAKYAQELLAESILTNCEIVHVRLASLIGASFDQRLVNKMVHAALTTGQISVVKSSQLFGFMDVRDAAKAITLLCDIPTAQRIDTVNVGPSTGVSVEQIAQTVHDVVYEMFKIDTKILFNDADVAEFNSTVDPTKLENHYGFTSKTSFKDSVKVIAQDYNNRLQA